MVVANFDEETSSYRFVIEPNYSLGWQPTLILFCLLAVYLLAIGIYFAVKGAWMVLPFAGIELLVMGTAWYLFVHRSFECEVVTIAGASVRVERGHYAPRHSNELARVWMRVILKRPRVAWYPSRLILRAHGKEMEVGACLCETERRQLAQDLSAGIAAWRDDAGDDNKTT